jgi:hypothetical protein
MAAGFWGSSFWVLKGWAMSVWLGIVSIDCFGPFLWMEMIWGWYNWYYGWENAYV